MVETEPRWKDLSRRGANRGRVISAFLQYYMAQQEIPTLKALADELGIHPATVSWWKTELDRQRTIPENKHIARLAEILGCTQDDVREAFGLRQTPSPADAQTDELIAVYRRLSPGDQALIRDLALARLQRQSHPENSLEAA